MVDDQMASRTLSAGMRAPEWALPIGDETIVTSQSLHGKTVVLYFYPEDDTSGCTAEACEFRDRWDAIKKTGALLFGVSPDDAASHRKFQAKYQLPFPLLVDEGHRLADAFGVWGEKSMYGHRYFGILRTTFIIDGDGVIRHVFERVKPKGHAAEVMEQLGRMPAREK